jgi:hypothetical protein
MAANPKMNDNKPAPHAVTIGMVRFKLLKKVLPPRWLKTSTMIKKYATNKTRIKKSIMHQIPDFVLGKKLIFMITPSENLIYFNMVAAAPCTGAMPTRS